MTMEYLQLVNLTLSPAQTKIHTICRRRRQRAEAHVGSVSRKGKRDTLVCREEKFKS